MNQSIDWNHVFGEVERIESSNKQTSLHFDLPIPNPTQDNDPIKNSLGQNLFEQIKQSRHLMRSPLSPAAKKQLKETLDFFITIAKRDLALLEDAQLILMTTKARLCPLSPSQQQALDKMLSASHQALTNYHAKMRRLRIRTTLKSNTMMDNKMKADLSDQSLLPSPQSMLVFLNLNLEKLVQIKNALWESKAKQKLTDLTEEFNSLIDSVGGSIG